MSNENIGLCLKVGGIALGTIILVTLISLHPLQIGLVALSAGLYFAGEYLQKNY